MVANQHDTESDLARLDKLRDEDIDYSDIPEVDEQCSRSHLFRGRPQRRRLEDA
jgi:hypothetical protein